MRAAAVIAFAALFCVSASAQQAGRRVALVIANSAYVSQGTLANPGPDARLVADALRRVGFDVVSQNDLTKQGMDRALRDFSRQADGADVALVYFAGHGMEANGVNWLVPVDAALADERDLAFEAVSLDTVLATVDRAQGLRMVVLDACRNNPFTRSMRRGANTTRAVTRGLTDVEVTGTLVLYAARGGSLAQDGVAGANSPFATAFARRIPEPGVDIRLLVSKVRDDVLAATQRAQEPFSYGSLPGVELTLAPAADRLATTAPVQADPLARLRSDPRWLQHNGGFYRLTTTKLPIEEARAFARAEGGYLASVNNEAEHRFLVNAFANKGPLWIGLSDAESEGVWRWSNGDPLTFQSWKPGEPSGSFIGADEDYAVMFLGTAGDWIDVAPNNMRLIGNAYGIVEVRQ
jgi:hypothetical protein